jgi:hydrogenase nickel incorporation protein HypA/HybF
MLDNVLKLAKEQDAVKVTEISVQVGELTFVTAEQLGYAFEFVSKNTIAEGAKLNVEIEPAEIKCNTCGFVGEAHYHGPEIHESSVVQRVFINCPKCGSNVTEVLSGSEFILREVKLEK